jgi:uroporphyrinogen decarboxylase
MKIHVMHLGVFEYLRALMGFEAMAIKSIEEPDLLGDILEKLTGLAVEAIARGAAHPATGAVFYADDMGFKTSTMLSPAFFREWIIPCQKRIAEACHEHGKPFLFHSCGYVDTLMTDLIEVVKIDAIHSFEDIIEPVESVFQRYGDRIAVLGGVDVNLLARGTPQQVRARCRGILDVCGGRGGFALGSGNSVTNYCKIENFYAMIDEARSWNEEKGFGDRP